MSFKNVKDSKGDGCNQVNICLNGGTCNNDGTCSCKLGYVGNHCEICK